MKTLILPLAVFFCGAAVSQAAISFTVVRDYDAATNANAVENSATALQVGTYTGQVATAFDNGTGGVVNFDNGTGGTTGNWTVSYAGATKTLDVTVSNATASIAMDAVSAIKATPISGNTYFRLAGNGSARFTNTLSFGAGQYLSSFGLTFLARSAAASDIRISGTYNDGSTFTLFDSTTPFSIGANTVTTTTDYLNSPTSGPDRFVGFTADAGKAIASISFNLPANTYPVLDDFAFIVSPIPEPSGALLLTLSAAGFAFRRRRP